MNTNSREVGLVFERPDYCVSPPFHPSHNYPELKGEPYFKEQCNPAFNAIRNLFKCMELDCENYGTERWDPLCKIIKPGSKVVIKPNLVNHRNQNNENKTEKSIFPLITHGSIIRAVLHYVLIANRGRGHIIICDCPIQGANWEEIVSVTGLKEIIDYYKNVYPSVTFDLKDFRLWKASIKGSAVVSGQYTNCIEHYQEVDLGSQSLLLPLMDRDYEFGVVQYSRKKMKNAHNKEKNLYIFPKEILEADVLINIPKLKSHMKAGLTASLKNLVGINGHKDYLPHFRYGSPKNLGDEYPDGNLYWDLYWKFVHLEWDSESRHKKVLFNRMAKLHRYFGYSLGILKSDDLKKGGGSWFGNDTLWRTILDINRAFFYFDRERNTISNQIWSKTKYFCIVDGLIGGENFSPLSPDPVDSGVLLGGFNPLAIDLIASCIMGFDYEKIPQISNGFKIEKLPLVNFKPNEIIIRSEKEKYSLHEFCKHIKPVAFKPSVGWRGNIEKIIS